MQNPRASYRPAAGRGTSFRRLSIVGGSLLSLLLSSQVAIGSKDDSVVELATFEVHGFRSSLAGAIEAKRQAGQVMDTITAEQVGQFGDQNVGEAIQRISGVSLTRNNGEGESISVRGLSPAFTRIEIDGRSTAVTADSSEPGRDSILSVFASDLYSNIEVVKSPTAADTEGGVGGTVRLKTPDPLTIGRLSWSVRGAVSDGSLRDRREPGFSGFYSNVFGGGRLGLLLAVTHEDRDRRLDKVQAGDPDWMKVVNNPNPAVNGGWFPERLRLEGRTGDVKKLNFNGKIQFMATPNLELYAHTIFTREDRVENKARIQVEFNVGTILGGTIDPATDTLTQAEFHQQRVDYNTFRRETDLDSTGVTGGAKWKGDQWSARFETSYSDSEEDWDEYTVQARINRDGVGGYDLGSDPRMPRLYTASASLPPSGIPLRGLSLGHRIISIDETEARLDVKRVFGHRGFTSFETGARWAETGFHRRQGNRNAPLTKPTGGTLTFADGVSPYVLDGSFGFGKAGPDFMTSWPTVNAKDLYEKYPSTAPAVFNNNNFYDITEENLALYMLANFSGNLGRSLLNGNLGLRYVRTEFTGEGRVVLARATGTEVLDGVLPLKGKYEEPLPTLNFTLAPGSDMNFQIRGAMTRAMTRPTVSELNPTQNIDVEDGSISRGEPDLDPFLAWQYDLGVEYYFGRSGEGLLSLTAFLKDVDNFIVPTTFTQTLAFPELDVPSRSYIVSTFRNGSTASIKGFEFNLQSPFTFLPAPLSNFGGAVNYTYTDSEFTDANGNTFTFPGASRDTYNLVLYYEQHGFSGRLAYNFRNDYLITPSSAVDGSNALYGEGGGRLDLSLRYRFKNGIRISFDALNLTESQSYKYYDMRQRYQNFEFEGKIYSLSLAYTY